MLVTTKRLTLTLTLSFRHSSLVLVKQLHFPNRNPNPNWQCERAAAAPQRLHNMFKAFDKDGSGSIAYDEFKSMVTEFGCEMEGADAAASLLQKAQSLSLKLSNTPASRKPVA